MERITLILSQSLSQPWVRDLGWTLIQFLWQGTVLASAFAIARRFVSVQSRYRLAVGTLTAMAAAPVLTFTAGLSAAMKISWPASAMSWEALLPKLAALWAAGALLFSLRLAYGWRVTSLLRKTGVETVPPEWQDRFRKLATRMCVPDSVQLLLSSVVNTPATIGWLRPIVFFPASMLTGLPPSHIEALLAHELAHVKRMDYAVNILQSVAEAILFYHPAVWWVSHQIRKEREFICDDLAVAACGDTLEYARALADLESARLTGFALAANDGPLLARIRRLLAPEAASSTAPLASTVIAISVLWIAGASTVIAEPQVPSTLPVEIAQLATPPATSILFAPFSPAPQVQAPVSTVQPGTKVFTLHGRVVVAGTNEGVARAIITLIRNMPPIPSNSGFGYTTMQRSKPTFSGEDGSFSFENILPGSYTFEVEKTGYLTLGSNASAALRVTLDADRSPAPFLLRMTPQGVITGQVMDSLGEPVYLARVQLYRLTYQSGVKQKVLVQGAMADDQGHFRMPMLSAGSYYVLASPSTRTQWDPESMTRPDARTPTYYPGVTSMEAAVPINVTVGSMNAIAIRMTNQRLYSIRGRVQYDGPTIQGMFVQVIPAEEQPYTASIETGPFGNRRVLPGGQFEIADLPPGRYIVGARVCLGEKGNQCYDGVTGAPTSQGSAEVTIRASDVENIVIPVSARFPVDGTIRLENGDFKSLIPPSTPPGSFLRFPLIGLVPVDTSDRTYLGMPDQEGHFRLLVRAPGLYQARVSGTSDAAYVKSIRIDGQDALAAPVYIAPGSRLDVWLAEHPAVISGIIRDFDGKTQPATIVTMWLTNLKTNSAPPEGRTAFADDNGMFRFGGLGPGEYQIAAWEGESVLSGILSAPAFLAQFAAQAETVKLDAGQSIEITPKLIPASAIAEAAAKLP